MLYYIILSVSVCRFIIKRAGKLKLCIISLSKASEIRNWFLFFNFPFLIFHFVFFQKNASNVAF